MQGSWYTVQSYWGAAMKARLGYIILSLGRRLDAGQPVRYRAAG